MKIVFLANADSIHSHRWIRYFADKPENSIHWISFAHSIDYWFKEKGNVRYYECARPIWAPGIFSIAWYWHRVKRLINRIQPDIFHAHYAGLNGLVASLVGFHPFVLTAWGSDVLLAGRHIMKRFLVSLALHSANLITCDADHMRRAILAFGIPESRIKIIQFGIDTKRFSPGTCSADIKARRRIPDGYQAVISMRNFDPIYDVETFIRAIPFVLKQCPQTIFLIGGRGPQQEYLSVLVRELRVEDSVRFLGFVPNTDLPDYLRCASVYVSTSLSDAGIASSTAEAMACGIPVVVTDSGENALWIRDGEDGFVIPVKSPEVLAEKIIILLRDNVLREKFSLRGRKIVMERDDYWTEMEKMHELYSALFASLTS